MCAIIPSSVSFFRAFAGIVHLIHLFVHVCIHLESSILFYLYLFRREHDKLRSLHISPEQQFNHLIVDAVWVDKTACSPAKNKFSRALCEATQAPTPQNQSPLPNIHP